MSDTTPVLCIFPEGFMVPEYGIEERIIREIWRKGDSEEQAGYNKIFDSTIDSTLGLEKESHSNSVLDNIPQNNNSKREIKKTDDFEHRSMSEQNIEKTSEFGTEQMNGIQTLQENTLELENMVNTAMRPVQDCEKNLLSKFNSQEKSGMESRHGKEPTMYHNNAFEFNTDRSTETYTPPEQALNTQPGLNTSEITNHFYKSHSEIFIRGPVPLPLFQLRFFYLNGHAHLQHPFILPLSQLFKYNAWPGEGRKGCFWKWIEEVLEMRQKAGYDIMDHTDSYSEQASNSYHMKTNSSSTRLFDESHGSFLDETDPDKSISDFTLSSQMNKSDKTSTLYSKSSVDRFFNTLFCRRFVFIIFDQDKLMNERFDEDWMMGLDWEEREMLRKGWRWFRSF